MKTAAWAAFLFALVITAMAWGEARAGGGGTVVIGSGTVELGQTAYFSLVARGVPGPATVAYSVTVQFDPAVIAISNCVGDPDDVDSVCERPGDSTLSFASASGQTPTSNVWSLGIVTLACTDVGVTSLTVSITSWESTVPGTPAPKPQTVNGTIRCVSDLPTLSIESATGTVGELVPVNIDVVGMPAPGLGAWTVDITYDPQRLQAVRCSPNLGSVCSMRYGATVGRFTGAVRTGVPGDFTLGTAFFRCLSPGTSRLTLSINVFSDATPDGPQPITISVVDGTLTCVEPTATPPATATPAPVLPSAGEGTQPQPVASFWPVALAAFGAVAIGVALALRRRRG